jgi:glycosyltransferase involved in cell wall biosynthesis
MSDVLEMSDLSKMSVTVTMPTKNRPGCAARAIEAFLQQRGRDGFNDEMVVVDTSDVFHRKEMRAIAAATRQSRGKKIHWIWLPSRTTLGAARNMACAASRNELVMLWDDDDMHGPDRIAHQTRAWHLACQGGCKGGANLVGECSVRMFHRDTLQTSAWLQSDAIKSLFAHGGVHGTALFCKKAWQVVGGFPEEAGAVPGEDVVFLTRLARHGFVIDVADTDEQASDSVFAINRYSHPEHGHAWQNFYHMHAATTTA